MRRLNLSDSLAARAITVAVAVGLIVTGMSSGGFPLGVRTGLAIIIWWAVIVAVGLSLWPRSSVPRPALLVAGLLGGLALLTGLSILWAADAEGAVADFNRVTLYLGVFVLAILASQRGDAARWANGLALGFTVIGVVALVSRCFPGLVGEGELVRYIPNAQTRLSYPFNYWNGLAIGIGLTFPMLLRAAVAEERMALRGVWLAPLPALAVSLYLTSSRGGFAVAAAGVLSFLALCGPRLVAVAQATAFAAAGSLAAIYAAQSHPQLVDGPLDATVAAAGRATAAEILMVCVATGLAHTLLSKLSVNAVRLGRRGLAVVVGVVVLVAAVGVVQADVPQRFRDFKQPQGFASADQQDFVRSHLLSGGGSGRWQFWSSAVDQWRETPVLGGGAGSFEAWWGQHGTLSYYVRNAHSAFAETLGELGIVGFLLIVGLFAVPIVVGVRRLRRQGDDALTISALTSVSIAFALGASLDWIWELPAVTGAGMLALALIVGPSTLPPTGVLKVASARKRKRSRFGAGVAALTLCWAVICAQAVPWLIQREINASQAASARTDERNALDHADQARRLGPWAARPLLQLAVVQEQAGDLRAAQRSIAEAIERNDRDWRLLVASARINTRAGQLDRARQDLREALRLSPRSPLLNSLSKDAGT